MPDIREWTVMFYLASDNSLASTMVSQLKALKDAGFHPDVNVIAHFDPHVVDMPVHVFDINYLPKLEAHGKSMIGFEHDDPFVRNLVLDKLWGEEMRSIRAKVKDCVEHNRSGSANEPALIYEPPEPPATMSKELSPKKALEGFLNFCRDEYPARHYALIILGHGQVVGDDSFLLDDFAEPHSVLLKDLGEIISRFSTDVGKQGEPGALEMVGFHSCSMSGLEVAYELDKSTKYMLASQGPAYVGSWPYKQILIRLFKYLDQPWLARTARNGNGNGNGNGHKDHDAHVKLFEEIRRGTDSFSTFLRSKLNSETRTSLEGLNGDQPDATFVDKVILEIDETLDSELVETVPALPQDHLSEAIAAQLKNLPLRGGNKQRFKRFLLADVYPEAVARYPQIDVQEMLGKIFSYCFYNNFDFKLAGYSFDLCLTDVQNVWRTRVPIERLAKSLIAVLKYEAARKPEEPRATNAILLAHLDSQSFSNEDYVDLFDFCFKLRERWPWRDDPTRETKVFTDVFDACLEVMNSLRRGFADGDEEDPNSLVMRSAFAGPAFQYSHGMSIFFPWSEPFTSKFWRKQYRRSALSKQTSWGKFLRTYFNLTMRHTRADEHEALGLLKEKTDFDKSLSGKVLGLLDEITGRPEGDQGQLSKPGPDHPMGKWGPDDPTGNNSCACPTIKNYPRFTLKSEKQNQGRGAAWGKRKTRRRNGETQMKE
jgi:hypothetical protein